MSLGLNNTTLEDHWAIFIIAIKYSSEYFF